jgi:uncharacterized membrane protein
MADAAATVRLPALDWMRGLVIALMAVDHCDFLCNPDHATGDSVWFARPGPFAAGDFLTRWATHLCAPTFVFLAGAGMALSVARSQARGEAAPAIDGHWLLRGAVLLLLEVAVMSMFWRHGGDGADVTLQVLWALGGGLVLLVPLRRLPPVALLALAPLLVVAVELLYVPVDWQHGPRSAPMWNGLLVSGGFYVAVDLGFCVIYPLLAWFPAMLLGWVFGRRLARPGGGSPATGDDARATARSLLAWGVAALLGFVLLRWLDGFGNARLLRSDDSWISWLRCSKYPPSATFLLMELGLMAVLLAGMLRLSAWKPASTAVAAAWRWLTAPLLCLGQVPLFFYVLHLPVVGALHFSGLFPRPAPWSRSWLMAACAVALLLPFCWLYRAYKRRGHAWTRYL